jgi:hypothetical protein
MNEIDDAVNEYWEDRGKEKTEARKRSDQSKAFEVFKSAYIEQATEALGKNYTLRGWDKDHPVDYGSETLSSFRAEELIEIGELLPSKTYPG